MGSGVLHSGGGQLHHGDLVPQASQPVGVIPHAAANVVNGGFLRQPAQQEFLGAGGLQLANAPLQPSNLRALFVKVVSLPVDLHGFAPLFWPIIPCGSVRDKKEGGRHHQIPNTTPSGQPAGPLHLADHRVVLRQKGHLSSTWHHRRLQPVTTMRQDAQKQRRKLCRSKENKKSATHPEKPEKGETGCVLFLGGGGLYQGAGDGRCHPPLPASPREAGAGLVLRQGMAPKRQGLRDLVGAATNKSRSVFSHTGPAPPAG